MTEEKKKFEWIDESITRECVCDSCKHFSHSLKCKAFPDGIPQDIIDGYHEHQTRHPEQDNDIVWTYWNS